VQVLNSLDFDDQLSLNDDIQSVPAVEPYSFVNDGERHLTAVRDPRRFQLEAQTFLVQDRARDER
jgi:hypothetical protein